MTVFGSVAALLVGDRYATQDELTKGGRWLLLRLAVLAAVFWLLTSARLLARLPKVALERRPPGGFAVVWKPPEHRGKKGLLKDTRTLVQEIGEWVKSTPDPRSEAETLRAEMTREMLAKATDDEKKAVISDRWPALTQAEVAAHEQDKQDLEARFGGRVKYLALEYERRGLLPERESVEKLEWRATSRWWVQSAASTFEAMGLRLK